MTLAETAIEMTLRSEVPVDWKNDVYKHRKQTHPSFLVKGFPYYS